MLLKRWDVAWIFMVTFWVDVRRVRREVRLDGVRVFEGVWGEEVEEVKRGEMSREGRWAGMVWDELLMQDIDCWMLQWCIEQSILET